MKEILGMTADRHTVHAGDWYWSNEVKPVRVIDIAYSEWNQNTEEVVIWFRTEDGDGRRKDFDGSRLAKYLDGKLANQDS